MRERAIVATTGLVTPLLLKALLKAFRIMPGVKPRIGPLTGRGVACRRITLCSIGLAFVGFGGFAVILGSGACP